jgi:hypothetical protein
LLQHIHRPTVRQNCTGGLIDLPYSGKAGYIAGDVPFCTQAFSGGSSFTMYIDTRITYEPYAAVVFILDINDNNGSYKLHGRILGPNAYIDLNVGGKTLAVQSNNGYIRLAISTLNHPSGTAGITGVVRHM